PQHVADCHRTTVEERNGAFELLVLYLIEPRHGQLVDAAIAWSQEVNLPRAHELRQGVLGLEPALDDSEAHAPVDLTQMPCQLADRAPLRIGAVVVLSRWKGLEETDGSLGLAVPDSAEGFDLIQVWHGGPPGRIVVCPGIDWRSLLPAILACQTGSRRRNSGCAANPEVLGQEIRQPTA